MPEYTFLSLISVVILVLLDQIWLKTKIIFTKKFLIFWLVVIFWHTIVDNYLNGRWFLNEAIVGPYAKESFLGLKIWHTPLENYLFGLSLIGLNLVLLQNLKRKSVQKNF